MEMEVRELRIGNYVYPAYSGNMKGDEIKVVANDILKCEAGVYFLNPIPLTEEWLVKLGFDTYGHIYAKELSNGLSINYNIPHKSWFVSIHATTTSSVKLNHVHQLQNLYFALTGGELTIEDAPSSKEL